MIRKILLSLLILIAATSAVHAAEQIEQDEQPFSARKENLAEVSAVRVGYGAGTIRIVVDITKKVDFNESYAENPSRVVIDLKDSWLSPTVKREIELKSLAAKKIRVAQFDPTTVRIVIETMAETKPFHLDGGPKGHRFVIDVGNADFKPNPEAVVKPQPQPQPEVKPQPQPTPEVEILPEPEIQTPPEDNALKEQQLREQQERELREQQEQQERELREQQEQQERELLEQKERELREQQERELRKKIQHEQEEKARLERELREQQERELKEKQERELREKIEREVREKVEREMKEKEKQERELKEQLEREQKEKEKLERELKKQLEREQKEKLERDIKEQREREKALKEKEKKDKKNKKDDKEQEIDTPSKELEQELDTITALKGKKIVIDPGHGGNDAGAIGPTGVMEKNVTLKVSLELRKLLEAEGATVILTRETDRTVSEKGAKASDIEELGARCEVANRAGADIFISIHADSFTRPEARGTTGYYYSKSTSGKGQKLADCIRRNLVEQLGTPSRGTQPCNFFVVKHTDMPATLIELGFISNKDEEKLLDSKEGVQKAAQAILDGIEDYFG